MLLEQFCTVRYKPSSRTSRVFAIGVTALALPRELRKLAFSGCYSLDLKSAQLAIAAKLWELPVTIEFPQNGGDIWRELCSHCQIDMNEKPIIKKTLYSCLFGMSLRNLRIRLREGTPDEEGIGDSSKLFFEHPITKELLEGRKEQGALVLSNGGAVDAFGREIQIPYEKIKGSRGVSPNVASVLAQVIQSYELNIMLQALPIIRANREIRVMAWLHDGVTLHLGNRSKRGRWIKQICNATDSFARSQGFHTWLEVERLDGLEEVQQSRAA